MPLPQDLEFVPLPADAAVEMWPRTRYDLLAWARFLHKSGRSIVAGQIRLAVQLADVEFGRQDGR